MYKITAGKYSVEIQIQSLPPGARLVAAVLSPLLVTWLTPVSFLTPISGRTFNDINTLSIHHVPRPWQMLYKNNCLPHNNLIMLSALILML